MQYDEQQQAEIEECTFQPTLISSRDPFMKNQYQNHFISNTQFSNFSNEDFCGSIGISPSTIAEYPVNMSVEQRTQMWDINRKNKIQSMRYNTKDKSLDE